jgi:hypothetical protein
MKLVQKKVWVTVLTCTLCGEQEEMWHHQVKPTKASYPSSGEWKGWSLTPEVCFFCRNSLEGQIYIKGKKNG